MKVYEKINTYIVASGVSLDALSNSSGIPQDRLDSLLNGEEILYAKDLKAICLALNVSPEAFVCPYDSKGERKQ